MYVLATAGHVDHGKSTLVRALTGIEPDRWEEEHRRGLTIDLGFASTSLPSGRLVSFVDVPGHARFLGNMLSGIGPAPVVCFVVAADQGWQEQSSDHRDAVAALGIQSGLIVITRADCAPDAADMTLEHTRRELAGTGLHDAPAVKVSAVTGEGLDQLRSSLDTVLASVPSPPQQEPIRIWVDRAFSLRGAGTVVTGTLAAGTLHNEDQLHVSGSEVDATVSVRGLQTHGQDVGTLHPANRAAVNLRGVAAEQLGRGDVLLTPGAWQLTDTIDVRHTTGEDFSNPPQQVIVHLGTADVAAHCRRFDDSQARLSLARALPVRVGDRLLVKIPRDRATLAGAEVLDVAPEALTRRGDGAQRAATLAGISAAGDLRDEVRRRSAVTTESLRRMGVPIPDELPPGVRAVDSWLVDDAQFSAWVQQLQSVVEEHMEHDALAAGVSQGAAVDHLRLPDSSLLEPLISAAGFAQRDGLIITERRPRDLGAAEESVRAVEEQLARQPFRAPEADWLTELGLGERELAAAERQGRLLRLEASVVVLPSSPAQAMPYLLTLEQPFTVSAARQALGTSRRVAVPLLEYLDSRGWTRRLDASLREVAS